MSEWLSTDDAPRRLGVEPATIERWADEGKLPFICTPGGQSRFRRSDVERLLRNNNVAPDQEVAVFRWLRWLRNRNVDFVIEEISTLHNELGDWFAVADFLGIVTKEIGLCWADGEFSIIDEHIASAKLDQATAAVAHDMQVDSRAPVCLLATLEGERHSLGLCLCQLCLKASGIRTRWVGVDVPTDEIIEYLRNPHSAPNELALSASLWMSDGVQLRRHHSAIARVCRELQIEFLVGGEGAWPEDVEYGYRCFSFADLKQHRERLN